MKGGGRGPVAARADPCTLVEVRTTVVGKHDVRPAVLRAAELMRDLVGVITDRDLAIRHVAAAHHHDCAVRDRDNHPRRVEKVLEEISEPVGLPR